MKFWIALFFTLVAAASSAEKYSTKDVSAVYLLKSREVTVNAAGVKTERVLRRLQILQDEGLDRFGDIQVPYNAYYEKAKLIRAETITPDGERVPVQADLVKDLLPEHASGYAEYTDLRTLAFSMPALEKNAIIEYEVELQGHQPIIAGHFWTQHFLDDFLPVATSRYEITTPEAIDYTVLAPNLKNAADEALHDGLRTRRWELTKVPRLKIERQMPPGIELRNAVFSSSVPDWGVVETWFKGLLQDRISESEAIKELAQSLTKDATTRIEKINALSYFAQKKVRYVAIELGQGAYQPRPADSCLKNLYGDCKDKSVLLISLLKAVGIDAHLALVRPNFFGAVDQSLAHPGQFNHAIVFLPGKDRDRWLDPTVPGVDADSHPAQLDGCNALVMGPSWRFETIPSPPVSRSMLERIFEIFVSPDGVHRVISHETGHGRIGAVLREAFADIPAEELAEKMKEQAETRPGFKRMIGWKLDALDTLSSNFTYHIEYTSNAILAPHNGGFAAKLEPFGVSRRLILRDWDSEKEGRAHPWVIQNTSAEALGLRIHLPPGYAPAKDVLPYQKKFPHGKIVVQSSFTNGVFEARVQTDVHRSIIKTSRYDMTKRSVDRSMQSASRTIEFVDEVTNLLTRRKPGAARKKLEGLLLQHPENAQLHHRLGLLQADLGYRHAARASIRRAIELDPTNLTFYERLARIENRYEAATDTRYHRDRVLALLEEAEGQVTDTKRLQVNQAIAHATDDQDVLFGPTANKAKAIEIADALVDEYPDDPAVLNLRATLAHRDQAYEDAIDFYLEAIEQGSQNPEMMQGLWRSEAFSGSLDSAINRLSNLIKEPNRQLGELNFLMRMLAIQQQKQESTQVAREIAGRLRRPDLTPVLVDEIEPLFSKHLPDFRTFNKLDTPRNTMRTFFAARQYGDEKRFLQSLSPHVMLDCPTLSGYLRAEQGSEDNRPLQDSQNTIALQEKNITETALGPGLVQLKIQAKASALRQSPAPIEILFKKTDDTWRIIDLKIESGNPPNFLAGVLHRANQDGNTELATTLATYITDHYSGQASTARRRDYRLLLNEPCKTPENQARALAASALLHLGSTPATILARDELEQLAEAEPNNSTIMLLLSQSYSDEGKPKKAAAYMARTAALKADIEQFAVEKVLSYFQAGDIELAATAIAELEANFPASRGMKPLKRELAQRQGNTDAALALTKEIVDERPSPDLPMNELLLYLHAGQTERIQEFADNAEKNKPNPTLHRMLAYAYIALGDFDEALNQLETTRLLGSNSRDVLMETARTLCIIGKNEEAEQMLEDFERATFCEQDEVNSTAYVHHGAGQLKKALAAYSAGLPYQSTLNQVYVSMLKAVCLTEAGKKGAGKALFREVKANQHGSLAAHLCADFAAMMLGEREPDAVKARIDKIPDHLLRKDHLTEYFYYAGMKALFAGDKSTAGSAFEQCIALQHPMHMEYFLARMQLVKLRDQ